MAESTVQKISPELKHFLRLVMSGKHAGASGGEKRARRLALTIIEQLPGLDGEAVSGLEEFIRLVQASPSRMEELVGG